MFGEVTVADAFRRGTVEGVGQYAGESVGGGRFCRNTPGPLRDGRRLHEAPIFGALFLGFVPVWLLCGMLWDRVTIGRADRRCATPIGDDQA